MSTFIKSINIKKFGTLENISINFSTDNINLVYGANEAGKTTLMELIRYCFYSYDKKHNTDKINDKNAEALVSYNSDTYNLYISDKGRTITPESKMLESLNEIISPEIFRHTFAFGQHELFNIRYNDIFGKEKNAVLAATGVNVNPDIGKIMKIIDNAATSLYRPRGKVKTINKYLSEINKLKKEFRIIANEMKENENLFIKYEDIGMQLKSQKDLKEKRNNELSQITKLLQPFDMYFSIKEKISEYESLSKEKKIDKKTFSEIHTINNDIKNIKEKIRELDLKIDDYNEKIKLTARQKHIPNISNAEKILSDLDKNSQIFKTLKDSRLTAENAENSINKALKKLNIDHLNTDIFEDSITDRFNELNREYQRTSAEKEQMERLKEAKELQLSKYRYQINDLSVLIHYDQQEIQNDYDNFLKSFSAKKSNSDNLFRINTVLKEKKAKLSDFDPELHNMLTENLNDYTNSIGAVTYITESDDINNLTKKIHLKSQKTEKYIFPNTLKFTFITTALYLISANITKSYYLPLVIVLSGFLADFTSYLFYRKTKTELNDLLRKANDKFSIRGKNPADTINNLINLKVKTDTLKDMNKKLAGYGITYKNFREQLKISEEKKQEYEINRSTIDKLEFDKEAMETDNKILSEKIDNIINKYGTKTISELESFFTEARKEINFYNDLQQNINNLTAEIDHIYNQTNTLSEKKEAIRKKVKDIFESLGQQPIQIEDINYLLTIKQDVKLAFENIRLHKERNKEYNTIINDFKNRLTEFGIDFTDINSAYDELKEKIIREREILKNLEHLKSELAVHIKERTLYNQKLQTVTEEYNTLMAANNITDLPEAENAVEHHKIYNDINLQIANEKDKFKSKYNVSYHDYEKTIYSESYAELRDMAKKKQSEIEELTENINKLSREEARTEEIITNMSDKTDLLENEKKTNYYYRKAGQAANDFITYKAMEKILEKSIRLFEEESQPELLSKASGYFAVITGYRYQSIKIDIKGNLFAIDDSGKPKSSEILSSGTKDQLYISIRLAYIEMLDRNIKLPLIFDETTINFDDIRQTAFIDTLSKISGNRQIIFFTCHDFIKNKFVRAHPETHIQNLVN